MRDEKIYEKITNIYDELTNTCKDDINKLYKFKDDITYLFHIIIDDLNLIEVKNSLVLYRFFQSLLSYDNILILLLTGNYLSCIHMIRYYLECIIQAFYLDNEHRDLSIENKLSILKEISDKRDYFMARLLERIKIKYKADIKNTYKSLSVISHPSYEDFPSIEELLESIENPKTIIDCDSIKRISIALIKTYDIIFYILIDLNEDLKTTIVTKDKINKMTKHYDMKLLNSLF